MEIAQKIKEFIENHLAIYDDEAQLNDDDNIFELGFVDSLFALQLIGFIEKEFSLELEDSDLDIKNFSSVNRIVAFINKKLNIKG